MYYCLILLLSILVQERETLTMQVPKGNDARKKGWRDVVSTTI